MTGKLGDRLLTLTAAAQLKSIQNNKHDFHLFRLSCQRCAGPFLTFTEVAAVSGCEQFQRGVSLGACPAVGIVLSDPRDLTLQMSLHRRCRYPYFLDEGTKVQGN